MNLVGQGNGTPGTNISNATKDSFQKRAKSMNKNSKWIDRDSSLFMEGRASASGTNQFDNTFTDNEDKMRVNTPSLADNSINELIKKRHNSTERSSSKGYRPKSSKGHRGYNT